MTSPQQSSPFKILNTAPTASTVTPGNTAAEVYSAGSAGTTKGRITGIITGLASSTVQYQIGMFVNGVNTDNITPGWQSVTLNSSGQYLLSSISGGGYIWNIEKEIASQYCKVGIWVKDCAGNVNDPTLLGSTAMSAFDFRIQDQMKPTGTVNWPTASSLHYVGAVDNVTWTMSDNVAWPTLGYQVWLSTNGGTAYTELIGSGNVAEGIRDIAWTPSTAGASCKIRIDITDGEVPANTQSIYSGLFPIVQPSSPIVASITVPAAGAQWPIGSSQNITFSGNDPSSTAAKLDYTIELAADGTTFHPFITISGQTQGSKTQSIAVPDIAQAPWTSAVPVSTAKIKVTATNPVTGLSGSLISSTFSVTAASFPVTSETVALVTGWNLISLPLIPTNTDIQNILGATAADIESVWTCAGGGASGGTWSYYAPGVTTSTLKTMVDGKAYWIKSKTGVDFTFQGRKGNAPPSSPPTYSFSTSGWHMVGYKSTQVHTVQEYAGDPVSGNTKVYTTPVTGFDATTQEYTSLQLGDNMAKGSGYWFYYNSAGIIAPPSD